MAEPVISPPEVASPAPPEHSRRQLEALLEVSEAIAQQRDLHALFHDLAERLHCVVEFDFLSLMLNDPERNVMRLHILEARIPTENKTGSEMPVDGHPSGWVLNSQQSFVIADVEEENRYPEFLQRLREVGVRSLALVPLTTAQRRLGAMGFGRLVPAGISAEDVQFMQRVAAQVAVAVDNALNYESSKAYQEQLARERDRLRVLLETNNVLVTSRELSELFRGIVSTLERVIHHDYTSLALLDHSSGLLKIHALDLPGRPSDVKQEFTLPPDASPSGHAIAKGQPMVFRGAELDRYQSELMRLVRAEGVQVLCCVPLNTRGRIIGTLNVASRRIDAFPLRTSSCSSRSPCRWPSPSKILWRSERSTPSRTNWPEKNSISRRKSAAS